MALLELRGHHRRSGGASTNTLEGDIGVRWTTHDVTMSGRLRDGLRTWARPTAVSERSSASRGRPQTDDLDGDGIPDSRDECPRLPEDLDGFEDDDGCMDPDNDNDFIPDVDDKCPNEEAIEGRDADEDGCTDPE